MASICVIGGGIAGLAVAARLAAKKHDVRLIEKNDRLGGQIHTERHGDFAFDIGPSMLTLPAVYRDLFLKTGRPLEDEVELEELEPGFSYTFADRSRLDLPGGSAGRAAAAVATQFGEQAGNQWRTLTQQAGQEWRHYRESELTRITRQSPSEMDSKPPRSRLRTFGQGQTLHKKSRHLFRDERLRQVLNSYAAHMGEDPRTTGDQMIIQPFIEQAFGLWQIKGGMAQLVDAITRRCESIGVTIETGSEVSRLVIEDCAVTGVQRSDGSLLPVDLVVSDIAASNLYRKLVADPEVTARVLKDHVLNEESRGRASAKLIIKLGISGVTEDPNRHRVFLPKKPSREHNELRAGKMPTDPTIWTVRNSDPQMSPDGHESWCIQVNAPSNGPAAGQHQWNESDSQAYAETILNALATRGLNLRERIVQMSITTPDQLQSELGLPGGAPFGDGLSNGARSGAKIRQTQDPQPRPANISPIRGLFLVGGSTHPGPGLPFAGMSAENVAEEIGRAR